MRLEHIPIVLGVIVCLIAVAMMVDAASPESARPFRERRRRQRAEINSVGELFAGLGTLCMGVALIANDAWRWKTVVILGGVVLMVLGTIMNRAYLREMLLFRGAARRTGEMEVPPDLRKKDGPPLRIR